MSTKLSKFQKFKRAWETKLKSSSAFEQSLMKATHPMDDGPPEQKHVMTVIKTLIDHEQKQPLPIEPYEVYFSNHEKNIANFIANLKSYSILHTCFLRPEIGHSMANLTVLSNEAKKFNSPVSIFIPQEGKFAEGVKYMFRTAYGKYLSDFARIMLVEDQAHLTKPIKKKEQVMEFINTPNYLSKLRMTANLISSIEDLCKAIGLDDKENFNPDARMSSKLHQLNEVRKSYLNLNIVRHVMVNVFCDMINIFLHLQFFASASLERVKQNSSVQELANVAEVVEMFQKIGATCQRLQDNIIQNIPEVKNTTKMIQFTELSQERVEAIKKTLQFEQADLNQTFDQLKEMFGGDVLDTIEMQKDSGQALATEVEEINDMVKQMEVPKDDHFNISNLQEARNSVYATTNQERRELEMKKAQQLQSNFHNQVVEQLDAQFDPMRMTNQDQLEEVELKPPGMEGNQLDQTTESQVPEIKDEFDFQEIAIQNVESKAQGVFGLDSIDDFDFGTSAGNSSGVGFSQLEKNQQPLIQQIGQPMGQPKGQPMCEPVNQPQSQAPSNTGGDLNLLDMDAGYTQQPSQQQSNEPIDLISMEPNRPQTFTPGMGQFPQGFGQPQQNMNSSFATAPGAIPGATPGVTPGTIPQMGMGSNMYGMQNPMGGMQQMSTGQQQQAHDPFAMGGAQSQQPAAGGQAGFKPNPFGQQQQMIQQRQQQAMAQAMAQQYQTQIQMQMMGYQQQQQQQQNFGGFGGPR